MTFISEKLPFKPLSAGAAVNSSGNNTDLENGLNTFSIPNTFQENSSSIIKVG